ncbi:helix-turn-helix domain-containing protein [Polaribacter sp. Hel1_85]|uniref:helix-turn-helix domain-containing protein n=1 Tax=Polaribacter sp. Hel1_85 TaxID=1250005 RepID=UPI0005685FED|nr:helix-turn-helix domain-containing protein [Polaribacter sp. Hel1_85]
MKQTKIVIEELERIFTQLSEMTSILKGQIINKWIGKEEAMKLLGIKSKTTLQKLRDENKIIYSNVNAKIILYDIESIAAYLNEKSNKNLI